MITDVFDVTPVPYPLDTSLEDERGRVHVVLIMCECSGAAEVQQTNCWLSHETLSLADAERMKTTCKAASVHLISRFTH